MTWNGEEYLAEVDRVVGERVEQAGRDLRDQIRENTGIQGTPSTPSLPGEYNKMQSGNTNASIEANYDGENLTSYVGSSWDVARFLELRQWAGQRPWLVRSLNEQSGQIVQTILGDNFTR
jgi:hypothetical protein